MKQQTQAIAPTIPTTRRKERDPRVLPIVKVADTIHKIIYSCYMYVYIGLTLTCGNPISIITWFTLTDERSIIIDTFCIRVTIITVCFTLIDV